MQYFLQRSTGEGELMGGGGGEQVRFAHKTPTCAYYTGRIFTWAIKKVKRFCKEKQKNIALTFYLVVFRTHSRHSLPFTMNKICTTLLLYALLM